MAFSINSIGTGSSTSGSSFAITVPVGGVPAGAVIAVAVSDRATTYGSQAVTDSAGNTYTRAVGTFGLNVCAAWYYAYNVTALTAGQTITITKSGTDRAAASAVYITGAASGNPLDSGATATAFSASTGQPSVTSGTPATADCLMLAMDAVPGATATYTPDANWATPPISAETGTTGSDRQVDGGYQLLTGTPTKSFNPSYSAIPAAWAAAIIAFKPNTGGGTAYSLSAASGSFSFTGQAAALSSARNFATSAGAFALAGQDANLSFQTPGTYALSADHGAFALTGQSAGFAAARKFGANRGSFVLTGRAATLLKGKRLTAAAGNFAVTGIAAAFQSTRRMAADAGAFVLTGMDATLTALAPQAYTLSAEAGSFVLTGSDVTMKRGRFWTDIDPVAASWADISDTPTTWTMQ